VPGSDSGRTGGLIGLLALGQRQSEEPYSGEDKHLLGSVAAQAGVTLENILLAQKMAERMEADRRVAREMEIAREVQARLFPQKFPVMKTLEYLAGAFRRAKLVETITIFCNCGAAIWLWCSRTLRAKEFPARC